ncbi:MAG: filamentous hemagglutinin N-terminal domain-containing protein [Aulosira sp. DedQUE10]|nr:filamentous hemagglutinin N-terminal domain-containing protein [Aulosira sp. DedQUE10]
MPKIHNLFQKFFILSLFLLASTPVKAQITPDNTLGAEASSITPNTLINGANADLINGGAQRGNNLFHSFTEFNINDGQRVYFGNPSGIQNILSRVTGGNASNILGTLGVNGNANLFLINPNGILFGNNASLDIRGSFVGTTANGVQFGNQGNFSATNPQAPPLLTVNPSALLFNQINQNGIINRSRQLAIPGSLYLIGGDITFDNGVAGSVGNRLELGAVAGTGTVELIGSGNQMQLAFPEDIPKADIVLQNNAFALTTGGGAISVNTGNLSLLGNSFISATLAAGEGTPGIATGDIVVNATGDVTLDNVSRITSLGLENSLGDTGNIAINAQSIRLTNQSKIDSDGQRSRGNIILNAKDNVSLDSNSFIGTSGIINSIGKSGDITIATRNINLSNQSGINSANIGQGQGGKITLNAQETISLNSESNIVSSSFASAFGQVNNQPSGDIEITTRTLTLDGSNTLISSANIDEGRGGDIRIVADDSILLNGIASISSSSTGQGDSGNIELKTRELTLSNGGNFATRSLGGGNSGDLLVNASDSVTLNGVATLIDPLNPQTGETITIGSGLTTTTFGAGNSGELTINTQRLSINDGGYITTNSGQLGRGGNLTINAKDFVEVVGFSPNSPSTISTSTSGSGDAGSLNISAGRLSIRDGAIVTTSTFFGTGKGGNLTIDAKDLVEVVGSSPNSNSTITTSTFGSGDAGSLNISAGSFSIRDGAQVTTGTFGAGKGGNLTINTSNNVQLIGTSSTGRFVSVLGASANQSSTGDAGDLTITTQDLLVRDGSIVTTATFGAGKGGNLTVNANGRVEVNGESANGFLGRLSTSANEGLTGNAGDLTIYTQDLIVRDGGQVDAATFGQGKGGNLTVNANGSVQLIGTTANGNFSSGLFASSEVNSTGNAGELTVNTPELLVRDRATVSVTNTGTGNAGIMTINSDRTTLDNKASLNANTRSPNKDPNKEQATINLNSPFILLLRNSNITTNATGENVIGGNININTDILAAVQNSDISANSSDSRGGRVRITAQGIFGTQPRNTLTPESNITATGASPDLSGTTEINTPDVDPTKGLTELPTEVIDASTKFSQICPRDPNPKPLGKFVVTGRGSLPPSPLGLITGTSIHIPLATLDEQTATALNGVITPVSNNPSPEIIEAQGMIKTADGEIALVTNAAIATPSSHPTAAICPVSREN